LRALIKELANLAHHHGNHVSIVAGAVAVWNVTDLDARGLGVAGMGKRVGATLRAR